MNGERAFRAAIMAMRWTDPRMITAGRNLVDGEGDYGFLTPPQILAFRACHDGAKAALASLIPAKPDNPPAFPSGLDYDDMGMDLLDHFAGCALQGLLGSCTGEVIWISPDNASEQSYRYADAMLAERAKRKAGT